MQHAEAMDAAENAASVQMALCALRTNAFALVNVEALSAELTAAEQRRAVIALWDSHASAACVKSCSPQRRRQRHLQSPALKAIYLARSTAWATAFAISRQEIALAALDSFLQLAALITTHRILIATLKRGRAFCASPRLRVRGVLTLRRLGVATLRCATRTIRLPAALQARPCSMLVAAPTTASATSSRLMENA